MSRSLRIALTGIHAGDNPGPGLGLARSLRALDDRVERIVGLAYDALDGGCYIPGLTDAVHLLPYPSNDGYGYIEALLRVCAAEDIDVFIPNLDAELAICIRYQERLRTAGLAVLLPEADALALRDKEVLSPLAEQLGLHGPVTELITDLRDLPDILQRTQLPVYIKGRHYESIRATTLAEAQAACYRLVSKWGWPLLVQTHVDGEHVNLLGIGDGQGELLASIALRKMTTSKDGKVYAAVTITHEVLEQAARDFVRDTGWTGPFELECIDSGDGLALIEINPRLPAWSHLATACGCNVVGLLLDLATGKRPDALEPCPPGKLMVRYTEELVTDIDSFHHLAAFGASV